MAPDAASFGLGRGGTATPPIVSNEIDESTPWVAAADGNLQLVQTSLQNLNLTPSAADGNGYTLLHAAASYDQMEILQWLVNEEHVDLNAVDQEGDSALHYANSRRSAELLVTVGINTNIRNAAGQTALQSKLSELEETLQNQDADGDDDDDDEEIRNLRSVVDYLSHLPASSNGS